MKTEKNRTPLRTALIYALFGILWILVSDLIVELEPPDLIPNHPLAQILKGILFVLASAGLIYAILRRDMKSLQKSEAVLSEAQRIGHIGHWEWTLPGDDLVCSDEVLHIFRLPPDNHIVSRKTISNMLSATEQERLVRLDQKMLAAHADMDYEFQLTLPGGEMRWVRQKAKVTYGEDGTPVRVLGIVQDITETKTAEGALRDSEENYRDLVENSQSMFCTHDLEGNLLTVNETAIKITGYPREVLLQSNIQDALIPTEEGQFAAYIESIKTKGYARGLMIVRIANGEHRVWAYNNTLRAEDTETPVVRGFARDITERKQAEDALEESEERFRLLFETNIDAVVLSDADGVTLAANPAACRMFEMTEEELKQVGREGVIDRSDPRLKSALEERARSGHFFGELTFLHKDGTKFPGEISSSLFKDKDGNIRSSIIVRDITERERDRQALQASEKRFRSLIEYGLDSISLIGPDGTLLWESPSVLRTLEYEHEQFKGQNIFQLVHPEDLNLVRSEFEEILREPGRVMHEFFRLRHSDGSWRWMETIASNLLHEPAVNAVVVNYRDITQRRQTEQTLRESEERFHKSFHSSPVGMSITRASDNIFIDANSAFCEVVGYSREELLGQTSLGLGIVTLQQRRNYQSQVWKDGHILNSEMALRHKSGANRVVLGSMEVIEVNHELCVLSTAIDITERKHVEESLRKSEEKYRSLFDDMVQGAFYQQADGTLTDCNPAVLEMFGVERDQFLGKTSLTIELKIIHEDGSVFPGEQHPSMVALRTGKPVYGVIAGVYNPRRQDYVWLSITAIPVFSADEASPREVFVTLHDITERKLMEKYQQNFYNVLNTSRNELYIFDANTLHFEFVSAGALGNLGYALDEMRGMTPLDLKPDFTPAAFDEVISPLRRHEEQVITFETRHRRANGSFYPVEVHLQLFDQNDHHVFMAVILDITERNQAQEQLQLQSAMLEASANAIVITDSDGNVQWANPAFTTLTGFSVMEETLGRNPRNLVKSGVQGEAFYRDMWETILAGRVWHGELVNRRKDGTLYDEEMTITPFRNTNHEITHFIAIKQDITERKKAEDIGRQYAIDLEQRVKERTAELVRANRAKDEFLANMSHELRTPLNSVLGFSETLLEGVHGPINEKQAQSLQFIHTSGQHLLGLITDILDLSKIEAGSFELHRDIIPVNAICEASLIFVKQLAYKKSITVDYSSSPSDPILFADARRLKQVLVNLLSNAVKFTPEGGWVKMEVEEDREAAEMRFSISDSGIGISADDQQKLFHPFLQLDSSLSRQYEGTGLGLAMVRKLVEMHGGSVGVKSEPGRGSNFYFSIPIQSAPHPWDKNPSLPVEANKIPNEKNGNGIRILIVEDNQINMMVTGDYLSSRGYQVIEARNGFEALQWVQEQKPDVILMDIQLPGLDGFEAIKRLRESAKGASAPIIAMTALAMPGDRERCIAAGANEYLTKPVSLKELALIIENLLRANSE